MEYVSSAVGAAKVRRAARWIQEDGKALLVAIDMRDALQGCQFFLGRGYN